MKMETPYLPPDEVTTIRRTDEAKEYASAFGLLDHIERASRISEPVVMIASENHPTHWLVVGLFRGYKRPEDNGMNFMAFPKSRFSLSEIQDQLRSYLGDPRIEISKDKRAP